MSQFSYIEQNTYIPHQIHDYQELIQGARSTEKILGIQDYHIKQRMNGFIGENAKLLSGVKTTLEDRKMPLTRETLSYLTNPLQN